MSISLPLNDMSVTEKISVMEEIWKDLSGPSGYQPPDWHTRVLEQRQQLADSGAVGFTDWDVARQEIDDRAK